MNSDKHIASRLPELRDGSEKAFNSLFPLVYERLKLIAYRQIQDLPSGHTYSKTELVHEAYLKLANNRETTWKDRAHFYAVSARAMRHILIDHERKKRADKRGGHQKDLTLIDEVIQLEHPEENELTRIDDALNELAEFDDRMAKIVEFRYFGDMKIRDIAEVLNVSPRTIKRDWAVAKGWLYRRLQLKE